MTLAVSNIAWPLEVESQCLEVLKSYGVKFLEVAPTKYWPNLEKIETDLVINKKREINSSGLEIVSAQSLLFGKSELKVFGDFQEVLNTTEYLKKVIDICALLGCKVLVFGSPKNRIKGARSFPQAVQESTPFFKSIGEYCHKKNLEFCIEPNAQGYGCDFINNVREAVELVEAVNTKGFGLHLDVGNMIMAGEDICESIQHTKHLIKHFHLSAPNLAPITDLQKYLNEDDWREISKISSCISVEMLIKDEKSSVANVLEHNLEYLIRKL